MWPLESSRSSGERDLKTVCRYISQDVCPYNIKFAQALRVPAFAPREMLSDKDARHFARELLEMTREAFSGSFKNSPMKRAKLRGLKRNAGVVLGNVGTAEDLNALTRALEDPEPLVHEQAVWAIARLRLVVGE